MGYGLAGIWYVLRTQRNAWIHSLATLAAISLGIWLRLSRADWALLVIAIGIVWLAELMNTALEALIDLVSPEIHPLAKVAKDVSAGAVLLTSVSAFVLGLLIFLQPLRERMSWGK
ncbi:MAG: diacylglycerol kinase family protein [Chloroflexi bacterium]|nr:diacylglycerol kinase family protein [Chloroflexota bacterium]